MIKSVSIQGVKGSFHHIVAEAYFGQQVEVVECLSFDETVGKILSRDCDAAIMAIENSIAGSILPNYALIDQNKLHIIGEHYLDIQHHLMALPGQSIEDIKEVVSHPMALLQCKQFFKSYPHIRLVEDKDTAEVAHRINERQIKGIAAIASKLAAEMFGLKILAESIQTISHNETRFVIVKTANSVLPEEEINKASLRFSLEHKRGSLASILNVMSDCRLNLTKIQSMPKIETPWKYAFFVDVTFDNYKDYSKARSIMEIMAEDFKVLGEYKNAH
ncbi:prephenate dehydratase [Aegicerativicinus sediminis]|uniref:prephenate dehydratase n=1 Tax=Aegicerativicinus sediminis TaxID=2893202 RepID=UPI001E2DA9BF|nr:prephenate dehydratase [Aegicerativicinus sediminis]